MIEETGDLWEAHGLGHWVAITTNGVVRKDGGCVMGRGVALEAARRFPDLPFDLGAYLRAKGNHVGLFGDYRVASFPVKHHWREQADLDLIVESARELAVCVTLEVIRPPVFMVRPGCGNGRLTWADVKPRIAPILDDGFIIVERRPR